MKILFELPFYMGVQNHFKADYITVMGTYRNQRKNNVFMK